MLGVPVFLHGFNDLRISLSLVQDHLFQEYLIERRSVHIPMTLGYLRNILMLPNMRDQTLHKIGFSQDGLPLYFSPDSLLADTPINELPVFSLGLAPRSTELSKDPISGQAGCR